jgi:competence CoiA-like predicted nuclease
MIEIDVNHVIENSTVQNVKDQKNVLNVTQVPNYIKDSVSKTVQKDKSTSTENVKPVAQIECTFPEWLLVNLVMSDAQNAKDLTIVTNVYQDISCTMESVLKNAQQDISKKERNVKNVKTIV